MTAAEFDDWLLKGERYLARRMPSLCEADRPEVISDVILRMHQLGQFGREKESAYFFSAVRNRATDRIRHEAARPTVAIATVGEEILGGALDPDPSEGVVSPVLASAIRSLRPAYRKAFLLRAEGYSGPEAAAKLNISLPALKQRWLRARILLQQRLAAAEAQS